MMAMMEKVFDDDDDGDDDDLYLCDDGVKTRSTRVKQSSSIYEKKEFDFFSTNKVKVNFFWFVESQKVSDQLI